MSLRFAQVAQRVFNTPLMYDPRKAEAFLHGLGSRIAGDAVVITNPAGAVDHIAGSDGRPLAGKLGGRLERVYTRHNVLPFAMVENIAIIEVEGTLVHKGGWVGNNSGETSYQGLQAQIAMARKSPQVKGVVFEYDSYGGEVSGAFETAAALAQLSREKPTISILTDFAYSAGYLLASQSRQIVLPRFGGTGEKKAEGNPYEPLGSETAEKWQRQADVMRTEFAGVVAQGRSKRISKAKALATEAGVFDASEAVAMGLVDAIGDPLEAFDAFVSEVNRG